jgi:hypothetical protein
MLLASKFLKNESKYSYLILRATTLGAVAVAASSVSPTPIIDYTVLPATTTVEDLTSSGSYNGNNPGRSNSSQGSVEGVL